MGEGETSCCSSLRRVHFPQDEIATVVCEIEDVLSLTSEDKKRLWFSRSDYDFSKSSARVVAQESERYGKSKHLDNTYVKTFDQDAQTSLNLWVLHGPQRRGLERWANSAHGDMRKKDQHRYSSSLLRAQTEMNLKGVEPSIRWQMFRTMGEGLSQRSRQFAQMMAAADAEAAKWEHKDQDSTAARPVSPKQAKHPSLGFGGVASRRRGPMTSPNLSGRTRTISLRSSNGNAASRITIKTRPPARVSRMA